MTSTSGTRDMRAPNRRMRWCLAACTVAALHAPAPMEAQTRESRLDRVFTGLAYRPVLPDEVGAATGMSDHVTEHPSGATSIVSPHDETVRYRIDDHVYRSQDGGATWSAISPRFLAGSTSEEPGQGAVVGAGGASADAEGRSALTALAESPLEPGLLWVGGAEGRLHLTRDGGASWAELDGPAGAGEHVRAIEASTHRGGRAYVVTRAEGEGEPDEPGPLVYMTDDYGAEWTLLSGEFSGLPQDEPVTVVREDPVRQGLLFAGTPVGVFVTFDDGGSWDLFQFGLPDTPVMDLTILGRDLVVSLADGALWVMDEIGPLRQVMDGLTTGEPYLFEPSPIYLDRLPADQGIADARGAIFDYLLPSIVRTVRLEVLDSEARVLTTFSGVRQPGARSSDVSESEFRRVPGTRSGVHRIVWDLHAASSEAGPVERVPPGSYLLRMTVDGLVRERAFEVVSERP